MSLRGNRSDSQLPGSSADSELRGEQTSFLNNEQLALARILASIEPGQLAQREDKLALSALWEVTHSRLDLYHQIATGQARRSFFTAQASIIAGFVLLVTFALLSVRAQTTASAITTAGLGAVSAALAGYIGRTFVRSQESAAAHLRAYFDQPLEFSKFLAAERLLSTQEKLSDDREGINSNHDDQCDCNSRAARTEYTEKPRTRIGS